MELDGIRTIYFIGIGGIGMSAVAGLAKEAGFEVSGSDRTEVYEPSAGVLDKLGISYHRGYDQKHLAGEPSDLYIVSAGEDSTNPELAYVLAQNTAYYSYSELASALARERIRVVVTGTNGKSPTAGWLGYVLQRIDNSSYMVGAQLINGENNFHSGNGHYFVFEGDEYRATYNDPTPKFHYYRPDVAVLTNLEYDHPDVFESLEAIKVEFAQLLANLPADGIVVYNADDHVLNDLMYHSNVRAFSFGLENSADVQATNIRYLSDHTEFEVKNSIAKDSPSSERYQIALPGELNVRNALAVITTLRALGFQPETVALYLGEYTGVKRRFEIVGEHNGITIIDDYAHLPTAVAQTLEAARTRYPENRIWAVFEPHTFSRTRATLPELAVCFAAADAVVISDIYPARENAKQATITSEEVVETVKGHHSNVRLVHTKAEALKLLQAETRPGDVVIVMAVGDFFRLSHELLDALRSSQ